MSSCKAVPNPQTPEEWQLYVEQLDDKDLYEVAVAAGSTKFMGTMLGESYSADGITEIQRMFAVQLLARGIEPPRSTGCIVDYHLLAKGI